MNNLQEPCADHEIDWNALASAMLSLMGRSHFRGHAISLSGIAHVHPSLAGIAAASVIANTYGSGPGGQKTVDAIRCFLSQAGIAELGFATTRSSASAYPLCPSEGWAMIVASDNPKAMDAEIERIE